MKNKITDQRKFMFAALLVSALAARASSSDAGKFVKCQ